MKALHPGVSNVRAVVSFGFPPAVAKPPPPPFPCDAGGANQTPIPNVADEVCPALANGKPIRL